MNHITIRSTYYDQPSERVKVNYSYNESNSFDCEGFIYIPSNEYLDMRGSDIRKRVCEDLISRLSEEKEYWNR